jgi:hypothetical protein
MKARLIKLLIPALILLMVASCGKINVDALQKTKKVALVSFIAEPEIDTSAATGGSIQGMIADAVQGDARDMKPKMVSVKNTILKRAPAILGFKIISEKYVINKKSYKSIDDSDATRFGSFIAPKGYKVILGNENEKILQAFKELKTADGAMIVTLKMRLGQANGLIGTATAPLWADMTFYVYDKTGQLILQKTASEQSDTETKVIAGVYHAGDFPKMADEAITKGFRAIKVYIDEETAKVNG